MAEAKNVNPKFSKSLINRDTGCPTCGSADFAIMEIMRSKDVVKQKLHCHNCKKFWYS